MKTIMLAALAALAPSSEAGSSAAWAGECSLAGLKWMAGSWLNASDPKGAQERWVAAPGGVLMGSSWEFPKGSAGYAEVMTIRIRDGAPMMVLRHFDGGLAKAWEERESPMMFAAATCDTASAVFDGQGPNNGEHLTYKRNGRKMLIVGDFLHHGVPDHEEWPMIRAGN